MKQIYTLISIFLITLTGFAQNYEFGIIHNSGYNFSVVAIPDIASTATTDISDMGFTLMLPAGAFDVLNPTAFNGRAWGPITEVNAATLTGAGVGDGTKDAYLLNLPAGQTFLTHAAGEQIILVSFDISGTPSSGLLEFLDNADPIATYYDPVLDSFYNVDLDGSGGTGGPAPTTDQFSAIAAGLGSFMFSTLSVGEELIADSSISVYPNPAKDVISLRGAVNEITTVEVYNIRGQRVQTISEDLRNLNVSAYDTGIYFLKVYTENTSQNIRFIKE